MTDVKDSIKKLRKMRDALCSQHGAWKDAFSARDRVIQDLQEIYSICNDKRSRKKQIEKKILDMFDYLQVEPMSEPESQADSK